MLKDWKKTYSSNIGIIWRNKKKEKIVSLNKLAWNQGWDVGIYSSGKWNDAKRFKTKSQAIKYARSYMRKH